MNILENTLLGSAYWQVNKSIAKALNSVEGALLLADLIAKRRYFREKKWMDEQGGFFNTADNLETDLILTKEKRLKLTKLLIKHNLLKVVKKGLPSKNYYYLNDKAVLTILTQSSGNTDHLSPENADDKSPGNPATNKNKYKKNKMNKNKVSSSMPAIEAQASLSSNEEIQEAKEIPLVKKPKKQRDPSIKGFDEAEMIFLASMKHLDEYDQGFLADMCDLPIEKYTDSQVKRLQKIRRKASKSKKIDDARPLDQAKIDENYQNHLLIEKHTLFVIGLDEEKLMVDYRGQGRSKHGLGYAEYGVPVNSYESPELYRKRVITEIKLKGERGELSEYVHGQ